jgi:hypothetical protein
MNFPSTVNFRAIVSAGGVPGPGSNVTLEDVKAAEVIWGQSILKMKGNTVRRNGKRIVQSISSSIEMYDWQLAFFCQQTHLLHYLQHEDLLFYGHPFDVPRERTYLGSSAGDI